MAAVTQMGLLDGSAQLRRISEPRPVSVIHGKDSDVLRAIVPFYAVPGPRILDCTFGYGVMWEGTGFRPVSMDINPERSVDRVGDFTAMPFDAGAFDVIVFDPPHLPAAAGTEASGTGDVAAFVDRYGLNARLQDRRADHVGAYFGPFLSEARRVLAAGGVVLAKIADLVHNHRYQWQHVAFVMAAQAAGMTPCDVIVKVDPNAGNLASGRWEKAHHARKAHCYWIVVRNGTACERREVA